TGPPGQRLAQGPTGGGRAAAPGRPKQVLAGQNVPGPGLEGRQAPGPQAGRRARHPQAEHGQGHIGPLEEGQGTRAPRRSGGHRGIRPTAGIGQASLHLARQRAPIWQGSGHRVTRHDRW
ncbi:unnamed protein product, partial [Staurois parvus]